MYCKVIAYKSLASNGPHLWKEFPQLFWAPITRLLAICEHRLIMSSPPRQAISCCSRLTFRLSFSHFWSCTRSPVSISVSDKSRGSVLWLHDSLPAPEFARFNPISNLTYSSMSAKHSVVNIPSILTLMSKPKWDVAVNFCSFKPLDVTFPSNFSQYI